MKRYHLILIIILLLFCLSTWAKAANYTVFTGTTLVDGNTFCGGSACTSSDTIIIEGGARGSLKFQYFNGSGSYITITNENTNPDSKVEITTDGAGGWGVLSLSHCKYVDLRGDNDGDIAYGIKVINDGTPACAGTVWVYGESDHIKISYVEVAFDGNTGSSGNGISVQDSSLSASWTFDTFEIHHNYIHDTKYAAMYLGHNWAGSNDNPYVATFSIHDNIMEDLGSYGITLKSIKGPNNYIYNNIVKRTGIYEQINDGAKHGIGVQMTYSGESYVSIYNNWIEKTVGPGLKIGGNGHLVYNNTVVGCGSGNDPLYAHGIYGHNSANGIEIYDNIVIQAHQYGIYGGNVLSMSHKRNLIGDCGVGEAGGIGLIEGIGNDANIYHLDVADFCFNAWSDDSDYSNDRLRTRSLLPVNSGSGIALNANLTWENFGDITGVDIFFEKDDVTPDVKVVDNANVEIYNPPSDLDYESTYYWQIISYGGIDIGGIYSFTTTSQVNPPTPSGSGIVWTKQGVRIVHGKGLKIQ